MKLYTRFINFISLQRVVGIQAAMFILAPIDPAGIV